MAHPHQNSKEYPHGAAPLPHQLRVLIRQRFVPQEFLTHFFTGRKRFKKFNSPIGLVKSYNGDSGEMVLIMHGSIPIEVSSGARNCGAKNSVEPHWTSLLGNPLNCNL